jgi:hypothetical protein
VFAASAPETILCWPNCGAASTTSSRLTFTGRDGNADALANAPENPASKSSDV